MLVLSRVKGRSIVVTGSNGERTTILIADVKGDRVRLGIDAPEQVRVHRQEVQLEIDRRQAEIDYGTPAHAGAGAGGAQHVRGSASQDVVTE